MSKTTKSLETVPENKVVNHQTLPPLTRSATKTLFDEIETKKFLSLLEHLSDEQKTTKITKLITKHNHLIDIHRADTYSLAENNRQINALLRKLNKERSFGAKLSNKLEKATNQAYHYKAKYNEINNSTSINYIFSFILIIICGLVFILQNPDFLKFI